MNIQWDSAGYSKNFDFVHRYGEDVLELITAGPHSFVVDLGCGNGALSEKLQDRGYEVLGIDASPDMLEIARLRHPSLPFMQADALDFQLSRKADVIFSNAVFHWIDADKQDVLIRHIAGQLQEGGQLVCEFGGKGCAETVHSALERNFAKRGLSYPRTFYFPTIGDYTPMLEKYVLLVEYAALFDRPTVQKTDRGLENWIRMFIRAPFASIPSSTGEDIIRETVEELKGSLYREGQWFVDYVRIRIKARKYPF